MPQADAHRPTAISVDQLIALNDEIAGLVRAGVPLEAALGELSRDLPGRLGRIAAEVARRSQRGQSLLEILSQQSFRMPPVYRAVVEAGLKSGRLPVALEALAGSIRRVAQTRRSVAMAAFYPLVVATLAWGLLAFFAHSIAPAVLGFLGQLDVPGAGLLAQLVHWGRWAGLWGPLVPLLVFLLAGGWWYVSGRASIIEPRRAARLLGWLPWMGQMLRWSQTATFAEVLALLVENRVPLEQAVVLAAEASGNRPTLAAARQMAAAIGRGEAGDAAVTGRTESGRHGKHQSGFSPLLTWLLAAGRHHGALLPALKHAAEIYRRRARQQADLARLFLPVLLTVAIGGTATLLYTLTLFVPYASILKALGEP